MAVGRDRVTVDLRGAGRLVHEHAASQGLTLAAYARRAILAAVPEQTASCDVPGPRERGQVKVTVRLPATHAFLLARRARAAEVSQGSYLAALIEGTPPPAAADRREVLAALARSTDQLAVICTDLNAFLRPLPQGQSPRLESYCAGVMSLSTELRVHLDLACRFLAEVSGRSPARSGRLERH